MPTGRASIARAQPGDRRRCSAPCRHSTPAATETAVAAANAALPAWAAKTAKERAAILRSWFDLMLANQDDLATLMTAEQGKPLAEAKGEIAYAASLHRVVRRGSASASTATSSRATRPTSASSC